jgi:hypothetical protein
VQGSIERYACAVQSKAAAAAIASKRRTRVIYVRVEVSIADGIAAAAEEVGISLARTWERAAERYLIEHFGRPERPLPSLP